MWVLGYRWDPVDAHDWQCQKWRKRLGRCKGQTVDRFTPLCRAHLDPEVEEMAAVVEAAYRAGVEAGRERARSAVALQRRWDEWVAGSSLERPAVAVNGGLAGEAVVPERGRVPVFDPVQESLFG